MTLFKGADCIEAVENPREHLLEAQDSDVVHTMDNFQARIDLLLP